MQLIDLFIGTASLIVIYMSMVWLLSLVINTKRRLIDFLFGGGFIAVSVFLWSIGGKSSIQLVLSVLAVSWSVWSMFYAAISRGEGETGSVGLSGGTSDSGGKYYWMKSYFSIYMFLGLFMLVSSFPIILSAYFTGITVLSSVNILGGLAMWLVGFLSVVISDMQQLVDIGNDTLERKSKKPSHSLWGFSKHPSHFGQVVMLWAMSIMCISLPYWGFAFVGPIIVTITLRYKSLR